MAVLDLPTDQIIFELCAESLDACIAARHGGAHRIELCTALSVGGITPAPALIEAAVRQSGLPVHVLVRPVAGGFAYSVSEMRAMEAQIAQAKALGASGVVLGVLRQDRRVDVERTRALVQAAQPLPVTFHRAFDETPNLLQSLEAVVLTGCMRVLTSGGAPNVVAGAPVIAELVKRAGTRLDVAVGGGLRIENARSVAQRTAARHYHGSLLAEPEAVRGVDALQGKIKTALQHLAAGYASTLHRG